MGQTSENNKAPFQNALPAFPLSSFKGWVRKFRQYSCHAAKARRTVRAS